MVNMLIEIESIDDKVGALDLEFFRLWVGLTEAQSTEIDNG